MMENEKSTGSSAQCPAMSSPISTTRRGFLARLEEPATNCITCDGKLPPGNLYLCAECDAASTEKARAVEEAKRRKELAERMKHARVSDDFASQRKGFRTFDISLSEQHKTAARVAEEWSSGALDSPGLMLFGPNGTGKSHLAESAIAAVVRGGRPALFITVRDLILDVRSAFSSNDSECDRLEPYVLIPFLALDDFGQGSVTQYVVETLFSLIDARLRARRRTLVTTNHGLLDLAKRLAAGRNCDPLDAKRIVDRLADLCSVRLEIAGSSQRGRQKQRDSGHFSGVEPRRHDATHYARKPKTSEPPAAPARLIAAK